MCSRGIGAPPLVASMAGDKSVLVYRVMLPSERGHTTGLWPFPPKAVLYVQMIKATFNRLKKKSTISVKLASISQGFLSRKPNHAAQKPRRLS